MAEGYGPHGMSTIEVNGVLFEVVWSGQRGQLLTGLWEPLLDLPIVCAEWRGWTRQVSAIGQWQGPTPAKHPDQDDGDLYHEEEED